LSRPNKYKKLDDTKNENGRRYKTTNNDRPCI